MDIFFYFINGWMLVQNVFFLISCAAFAACLIIFIYNLQNGKKNKWPAKHIVGTAISGFIMVSALTFMCIYTLEFLVYLFTYTPGIPVPTSSSSASDSASIQYLLLKISVLIK